MSYKMADPLGKEGGALESLKFAKLYSPKMKSVYWKYFGYPTNEDDRIITKQNVVCTLCHRVLTNHGNTTNLRAHLQYRHKDVFKKICVDNDIKLPNRKIINTKSPMQARRMPRKIKLELDDDSHNGGSETIIGIDSDSQAMLYETEIPMTYEDEEDMDREQFDTVEVIKEEVKSFKNKKNNNPDLTEFTILDRKQLSVNTGNSLQHFHVDVIEDCGGFQFHDLIVNMIIQDLRNVRSLYDPGMNQLLHTMASGNTLPPAQKIETLIKEMHSDRLTTLSARIKSHSQLKPFSLGCEIWRNIEKRDYISLYFNYATESSENSKLMNQLYCTFEYSSIIPVDALFSELNMENCTAVIVNYDYDDYLKDFLRTKDIPIIVSYDVVIEKCVQDVLALPSVTPIIEEIKEVIMRYLNEINSRDMEVPNYNEEHAWTGFELLKFFTESVAWPEDVEVLMTSSKAIINELNMLSVTLDTLRAEEIPLSSMLSPITTKILNKRYAPTTNDDTFVSEIKAAITKTLETYVAHNDHLTIAAILDPRFHRLTNINNLTKCTKILTEKHNKMCAASGFTVVSKQGEPIKRENSSRKSNLEIFFDIEDAPALDSTHVEESSVENDLKRYRKDVYVNLDESPLMWWQKMGNSYGTLKQLAQCYQCIPCSVNIKNIKKTVAQQMYESQKRFMLTGNVVDPILFLHHNTK